MHLKSFARGTWRCLLKQGAHRKEVQGPSSPPDAVRSQGPTVSREGITVPRSLDVTPFQMLFEGGQPRDMKANPARGLLDLMMAVEAGTALNVKDVVVGGKCCQTLRNCRSGFVVLPACCVRSTKAKQPDTRAVELVSDLRSLDGEAKFDAVDVEFGADLSGCPIGLAEEETLPGVRLGRRQVVVFVEPAKGLPRNQITQDMIEAACTYLASA